LVSSTLNSSCIRGVDATAGVCRGVGAIRCSSTPWSDTVKSKARRGDSVRLTPISVALGATLSIFISVPSVPY
jgi:hypothetical protein